MQMQTEEKKYNKLNEIRVDKKKNKQNTKSHHIYAISQKIWWYISDQQKTNTEKCQKNTNM